jgi:hypothetical protein
MNWKFNADPTLEMSSCCMTSITPTPLSGLSKAETAVIHLWASEFWQPNLTEIGGASSGTADFENHG